MKLVECSRCRSKELIEQDGYATCAYCRSTFVLQPADVPTKETSIGIAGDVQRLLQKCQEDPANRRQFASLILDIDPTNLQAQKYLG